MDRSRVEQGNVTDGNGSTRGVRVRHRSARTGQLMPRATLHDQRLIAARAAWMALTVLVAGLSMTLLLDAYAHYPIACTDTECRSFWRIAPKDVVALRELGVSVGFYAAYGLAIEMIYLLGFWGI